MSNDRLSNTRSQDSKVSKKALLSAGLTLAELTWLVANGASAEEYAVWAVLVLVKVAVDRWTE